MKRLIACLMLTGCGTITQVQAPCLGPNPAEPELQPAKTSQEKAAAVQDYIAGMKAYIVQLKAQMSACK